MNYLKALLPLLVISCSAGTHIQKTNASATVSTVTVHTPSLEEQEKQFEEEKVQSENSKYEDSVEQINDKFRREYDHYQLCLLAEKNLTVCADLLEKLCTVDVHLDRYGNHYKKPYCNQKQTP